MRKYVAGQNAKERIHERLNVLIEIQRSLDPTRKSERFMSLQYEMKGLAFALTCVCDLKLNDPEFKAVKRAYQIRRGGQ